VHSTWGGEREVRGFKIHRSWDIRENCGVEGKKGELKGTRRERAYLRAITRRLKLRPSTEKAPNEPSREGSENTNKEK